MNPLCDVLNINYPIIQGGMGNISDPGLASAVSEAGGLGTIGVGTMSLQEIEEKIIKMLENTKKPCCVNIPLNVHPDVAEVIKLVINHSVPVVSLSAGNPAPYISLFHEHEIKVICVTASVRQAKKAEASGADVIVCEGYEAAGINSNLETTTMTLIPQVSSQVKVPVVAAGGIGDGRGLLAALSLGACGVQMGTRFIATQEAPYHNNYKDHIIMADDTSTTIVGRRFKKIRRLMKTPYAKQLLENEENGMGTEEFIEKTSESYHKIGAIDGNLKKGFINSGQIAGLLNNCPSVEELIHTMISEAKEAMTRNDQFLS